MAAETHKLIKQHKYSNKALFFMTSKWHFYFLWQYPVDKMHCYLYYTSVDNNPLWPFSLSWRAGLFICSNVRFTGRQKMEQLRLLCVVAVSLCNLSPHHHAGKQTQFSVFDPWYIFIVCMWHERTKQFSDIPYFWHTWNTFMLAFLWILWSLYNIKVHNK